MTSANLLLGAIAVAVWFFAARRGQARRGLTLAAQSLRRTLVVILLAFLIVGYVNVLAPEQLIQRWIGPESGLSGLLLAEIAGMLLPGGPYVVFPLIAALYEAGAGIGPAVTLTTSYLLLALISVAFELPLMGWRFAAMRWGLGLPVPLIAGALAQALFS